MHAALAIETVRQPDAVRAVLTDAIGEQIERLGRTSGGSDEQGRRAAVANWTAMVGAVILARLVNDPALSEEILDATRQTFSPGN